MNKFNEFYAKLSENESLREGVEKILGDNTFEDASDEQLLKIGGIAKELGFEFSIDEVRTYFGNSELDDEALDAVAGGKGFKHKSGKDSIMKSNVICPSGSTIVID